jgi:O-antigen ligase
VIPPVLVKGVAVLAIVVGLTFSVVWMGGQELATKMAQGEGVVEPEAGTTRTQIWSSTWQLIKHRPLTGVGFGTYFLAIPQFQTGSGRLKLEQAHNDYLDLAANGGLIAVLIALCFVGLVAWRARASLKSGDSFRRAAALGAIAALISVAVHSFVDFGLQVTGIAVIALAMTVIAVVDVRSSAQTIRISRMEE